MKLLEHPLLRVEVTPRVQAFHQTLHAGDVFRRLQLLLRRWSITEPDQFGRAAAQLLIELPQAAVTGQGDDGGEFRVHRQHIAAMLCRQMPSDRC